MNRTARFVTGTALALALVAGSVAQAGPLASPAAAAERYGHRGGGVNVGAILLGAAVIGGIAAIATSHHDNDRYGNGYGQYDQNGYAYQNGYAQNGYAQNGYAQNGYAQNGYAQNGYAQNGYAQNGYAQNGYAQNGYAQNGYAQNGYAYQGGAGYAQGGDVVAICADAVENAARDRGYPARVSQIYRVENRRDGFRVTGGLESGRNWRGGYGNDNRARFECTTRYGQVTRISLN